MESEVFPRQCPLVRTQEAKNSPLDSKYYEEEWAIEEAKRHLMILGYSQPTKKQYLGQVALLFGQYQGATFKWLLENDVGYTKL